MSEKRYVEITKKQFDDVMIKYNARAFIPPKTGEWVYEVPVNRDLSIWIYSTLKARGGVSRGSGTDAIRTVLMYQKTRMIMSETKTLRTKNWALNLEKRIEALLQRTTKHTCPDGHPVVRRRGKGGKGWFYGCALYPDCKYIYQKDKSG